MGRTMNVWREQSGGLSLADALLRINEASCHFPATGSSRQGPIVSRMADSKAAVSNQTCI